MPSLRIGGSVSKERREGEVEENGGGKKRVGLDRKVRGEGRRNGMRVGEGEGKKGGRKGRRKRKRK